METQGDRIRKLRKELGLTQEQLAKACGYKTKSAIYNIESGNREMTLPKLRLCAKALNTTPEYLAGTKPNAKRPKSQDIIDEQLFLIREKTFKYLIGNNIEEIVDIFRDMPADSREKWIKEGKRLIEANDSENEWIDFAFEFLDVNKEVREEYLQLGKKLLKKEKEVNK